MTGPLVWPYQWPLLFKGVRVFTAIIIVIALMVTAIYYARVIEVPTPRWTSAHPLTTDVYSWLDVRISSQSGGGTAAFYRTLSR